MKIFQRYTPLQIAMHIYAWSALALIIFDAFAGNLSANPIQELEQRTGRHAITLLILSLACAPLNNLFGWRELIKRRRALGLYAFMYATIHIIIFVNLDYGFAWSLIVQTIVEKPYIVLGLLGFLMLIPLAMTSFDVWKKRLGKNWKRLHQTIYFIAPILLLHYALGKKGDVFTLQEKGDVFTLQGDIIRPLIYSIVAGILLFMRIPRVRRFIADLPSRIRLLFKKQKPESEIVIS